MLFNKVIQKKKL